MNCQALARTWRPQKFSDVVGQHHVLKALANSLELGRLHHAYLFSGTRGVGKTTIARLFAKGLNCEQGITASPCGECQHCREIEEGRFVDLIEIDAASRTSVEDTREILDNVQYVPSRGRFKVYLIDEVHMLSRHSFNALLKTLEEPPDYVKFLLATTDPQKLPVTVLSRCLQFHLKVLDTEQIADQLNKILHAENIKVEHRSLHLLAQAADGSLRDALSLADQAIALGNGNISYTLVRDMLGVLDDEQPIALIEALHQANSQALFAHIDIIQSQGYDWDKVLAGSLAILHRIAMLQLLPANKDAESEVIQRLKFIARQIAPQDLQLYYQILLMGRKELVYAPTPRSGVEMTFLRALAFHPKSVGTPAENRTHSASAAVHDKGATDAPILTPIVATAGEHQQSPTTVSASPEPLLNQADLTSHAYSTIRTATISLEEADTSATQEVTASTTLHGTLSESTPPAAMTAPIEAKQINDPHATLPANMAALLQARQQLQQHKEKKNHNGERINKRDLVHESKITPANFNQRARQNKPDPATVLPKCEELVNPPEQYQWKAQKQDTTAVTPQGMAPKAIRNALMDEKTPELIEKLAREVVHFDAWASTISTLKLPKLVEQLALNSFKTEPTHDAICLHLRSTHQHLNTTNAQQVLSQALNQCYERAIQLTIVVDDSMVQHTPIELREQIYQQKLQQARHSLAQDEQVRLLCHYFDAQLDEESIRPV